MNPFIAFIITLGISITTLLLGGTGVIDRLSARKHWDEQIKECQTAISGTDDEHMRSALRRKSHHFSKAVTLDKCVPISPTASVNVVLGYIGLLLSPVIQIPLFRLPGWIYLAALSLSIASALLFSTGITAHQIRGIEQKIYDQLGYPATFHRLPTRKRIRFLPFTTESTNVLKRRVHELNPQPQPNGA